MDVHDLARALCLGPILTFRREQWQVIAIAHMKAVELWPLIEAHTRAAVEAERAACVEIARAQSWSHTHTGMGGPELNSEAIRKAIAARKVQA